MWRTNRYRNPGDIEEGSVLVVGASATGIQLAEEIHRSGRSVTLAVGEHVRVPRVYRGRDIEWWMDAAGVMDDPYDGEENLDRALRTDLHTCLAHEAEGIVATARTEDHREAVAAFIEKRRPSFNGR